MSNEDIFNAIKDRFAGVVGMSATTIDLATTDGQVFTVDQASFEKDYWIQFHCHNVSQSCDSCGDHGSETWAVVKREQNGSSD